MKQKVVIQLSSMNGNKSRSEAMRIAVAASGAEFASFKDDKSQMEVTGELDAAVLTQLLREKVGHADLLSVSPADLLSVSRAGGNERPYIYYNARRWDDDDSNGGDDDSNGGDDHNNGGGGGKNNKKGRDHDGDGDENKSGYEDGGEETKGKNMDVMGKAGFGYGYAYHAGNENEYPVGQLQCAQEVWSSEPKCLFHHAIMIS